MIDLNHASIAMLLLAAASFLVGERYGTMRTLRRVAAAPLPSLLIRVRRSAPEPLAFAGHEFVCARTVCDCRGYGDECCCVPRSYDAEITSCLRCGASMRALEPERDRDDLPKGAA